MPKSNIIVLISAKKVGEVKSLFNFEAVYTKYKSFIKNRGNTTVGGSLSK